MPNISATDKGFEPAALENEDVAVDEQAFADAGDEEQLDEDVAVDEQAFADAGDEEQWQQASGEDVWHS
jgi:hypothetical protein